MYYHLYCLIFILLTLVSFMFYDLWNSDNFTRWLKMLKFIIVINFLVFGLMYFVGSLDIFFRGINIDLKKRVDWIPA